jgi:HAMP domain-containing protein/tRNA A-37 threonylcarbamoyl transferase component Bud32
LRENVVQKRIGRYEVQARIGEGATADVYRAYDPGIDRVLAIKVLKAHLCQDRQYAARFLREAKAAGALSHPNIATIYDVGEEAGAPYIAMELLDGETLDRLMARRGRLPAGETIAVGLQLADALRYAHALGVVHRDIKPANIMLTKDGRSLKILDFGIARVTHSDPAEGELVQTQVGQVVGTPRYMSPEQALGREIDGRSDLFSVGVVLYELITGKKAFNGASAVTLALQITQQDPEPIAGLVPRTPRGLQFVVEKLISKRPERRFADGAQLAEALRREEGVYAAVAEEGYRQRRSLPLPARLTLLMASVTAVALIISTGAVMKRQDAALRQMAVTSGSAIATFVASNAALNAAENAALPPGQRDWLPAQGFIKSAGVDPSIQEITVVDSDGVIRAASRPERVGQTYRPHPAEAVVQRGPDLAVSTVEAAGQTDGLRFVRPITYAGRSFGQVDVQVSQAPLQSAAAVSRALLAALVLATLGVVMAASYALARLMSDPLRRLKRAINDAAAGDFEFRISHDRTDEFGELFNAFNQLNAEIQDRLEVADMERRDRPLIVAGQPALSLAPRPQPPVDLEQTRLDSADLDLTVLGGRS